MDFDSIIDRRCTESYKWHYYPEDVLPMWLADMDFKAPEPVIQALTERVNHGVFGYGSRLEGLDDAILQHLVHFFDWSVNPEDLNFVCGVVTGFVHAIYSLTEPGESVLIQTPIYPPILRAPHATGRVAVHNRLILKEDGKYEIDFDDFEEKVASGVKLFILCNPHNPVGRVFTREELTKMAEICLKYNVWICSDEIHNDLIFSGYQHIPIANLSPDAAQITVTYLAPSKTFNIAGLSTSVVIAENPVIKDRLSQTLSMLLGHPNILGLHAARAAYLHGRPWLREVMHYLQANRDYLVNYVNENLPGIRMWSPEGTFLGWLDCRQLEVESPHRFFLDEAKVGFNDGISFGEDGQGFLRINFGCPRAMLDEGLVRMKTALEKL
ncbi:MAG: MalY/PatB family protein [Brevefilum fermentans]|jgi:cystathionine beta-lyase|nr:MalY/PatB family protein [Brevefilum fermentans]